MSAQQSPQRDHGEPVLGSRATLVGVGPFEAPNSDGVMADDLVSVGVVMLSTRRTAQLGVEWILTKRQGR